SLQLAEEARDQSRLEGHSREDVFVEPGHEGHDLGERRTRIGSQHLAIRRSHYETLGSLFLELGFKLNNQLLGGGQPRQNLLKLGGLSAEFLVPHLARE